MSVTDSESDGSCSDSDEVNEKDLSSSDESNVSGNYQ